MASPDIQVPRMLGMIPSIESIQQSPTLLVTSSGFVLIATYLIWQVLHISDKAIQYPPVVRPGLPYVGHVLNLIRYGQHYLEDLCSSNPHHPIFNAPMLHRNVYIVNSPSLIVAAERIPKALSFGPFIVQLLPRLFDIDSRAMKFITDNVDGRQGNWGFIHDITQAMHRELAAGSENLKQMVRITLDAMLETMDELDSSSELSASSSPSSSSSSSSSTGTIEIDLFHWVRKHFAIASTSAIYGPLLNPFAHDPTLQEAFWTVDAGFASLLFYPFPSVFARKAHLARARLKAAVRHYLEQGGYEKSALGVFKARYEVFKRYGANDEDVAKLDLTNLIGVLINATPMLFWMVLRVYSDEEILKGVRGEVDGVVVSTTGTGTLTGKTTLTIPTHALFSSTTCPLLHSLFRELLRHYTHTATNRAVLSPITLSSSSSSSSAPPPPRSSSSTSHSSSSPTTPHSSTSQNKTYHLPASSILSMPASTAHFSPQNWGPDAHKFDAWRFMPDSSSGSNSKSTTNDSHHADPHPTSQKMDTQGKEDDNHDARKGAKDDDNHDNNNNQSGDKKKREDQKQKQRPKPPTGAGAWRVWGGGKTICPGRFFATREILGVVALMVARFDVEPVSVRSSPYCEGEEKDDEGYKNNGESEKNNNNDGGKDAVGEKIENNKGREKREKKTGGGCYWNGAKWPEVDYKRIMSSVHPPVGDLRVGMRVRRGFEGVEWRFGYEDG